MITPFSVIQVRATLTRGRLTGVETRRAERRRAAHRGAQRARRADPARGGAAGGQRRHRRRLGRDVHERDLDRVAAGAIDGRRAVAERVEHVMGMPVRVDVARRAPSRGDRRRRSPGCASSTRTSARTPATARSAASGRGELRARDAHPLVREVLGRCEALRCETGGYFDARAPPGALDPSGFVKGWAVDRAARAARRGRRARFCVDAGGDVRAARRAAGASGSATRDAPRRARRGARAARRARSRPRAPTSAARTSSIRTRAAPPRGALSVTVLGPDLGHRRRLRDGRLRDGRARPGLDRRARGYDAMTILAGDRVLATPGFLRHCAGGSVAASLARSHDRCSPRADRRR